MADEKPWMYGYEKVKKEYEDKRRQKKETNVIRTPTLTEAFGDAEKFKRRNQKIDRVTKPLRKALPGQDADKK